MGAQHRSLFRACAMNYRGTELLWYVPFSSLAEHSHLRISFTIPPCTQRDIHFLVYGMNRDKYMDMDEDKYTPYSGHAPQVACCPFLFLLKILSDIPTVSQIHSHQEGLMVLSASDIMFQLLMILISVQAQEHPNPVSTGWQGQHLSLLYVRNGSNLDQFLEGLQWAGD